METLLRNKHSFDPYIRPLGFQPGGSAVSRAESSTGMSPLPNDLLHAEPAVGPAGRRLLCVAGKPPAPALHVMNVGSSGSLYRLNYCSLDLVGALVPVPTVESPSAGSLEAATGAVLGHADDTQLAERHLVPSGV